MRLLIKGNLLAGLVAVLAMAISAEAYAGINCSGRYQVVRGHGHVATPYCEDEYLARVARGYGTRVSGAAIRRSTGRKEEICRFIGHDSRVADICSNYRSDGCSDSLRC